MNSLVAPSALLDENEYGYHSWCGFHLDDTTRKACSSLLGVSENATASELKIAYRGLALQYHPDKVQGSDAEKALASSKFAEINRAYEVLTGQQKPWNLPPEPRKQYDFPIPCVVPGHVLEPNAPENYHFHNFFHDDDKESHSRNHDGTVIAGYLTNGDPFDMMEASSNVKMASETIVPDTQIPVTPPYSFPPTSKRPFEDNIMEIDSPPPKRQRENVFGSHINTLSNASWTIPQTSASEKLPPMQSTATTPVAALRKRACLSSSSPMDQDSFFPTPKRRRVLESPFLNNVCGC